MSKNNKIISTDDAQPFFHPIQEAFDYYSLMAQLAHKTHSRREEEKQGTLWQLASQHLEGKGEAVAHNLWGSFYIDNLEPRYHVDELRSSLPPEEEDLRKAAGLVVDASDTSVSPTLYQSLIHTRSWRSQIDRLKDQHRDEMEAYVRHCAELEGMSRREALEMARQNVTLQLEQTEWGSIYLDHRGNLTELLGVTRYHSGEGSGVGVDAMMHLAAQLEWIEGEMNAELSGGARLEPNSFGSTEPKEGLVPGTKCEMRNAECQDGGVRKDNDTAIAKGSMAVKVTRSEWFCALSDKERYEALAVLFVMMVQRGLINRSTRGMSVAAFCSFLVKEVGLADVQERSINRMLTPFRESINKGDGMRFLSEHVSKMKEIERLLK